MVSKTETSEIARAELRDAARSWHAARAVEKSARAERDAAIRRASAAGCNEREIATVVGIDPARVHRIVAAGAPTRGDRLREAADIALAQLDAGALESAR
jgi:predicted phage gp36 major capsid-like protein